MASSDHDPADAAAPARRRFRARPGCGKLAALPVALLLAAQVGISLPTRFEIARTDGSPVAGALVVFHYYGHRFNFVDSITYERSGGIARSDVQGRVTLPWRLYPKGPLDSFARPWIDLLYAPDLHVARSLRLRTVPLEGVVELRAEGREIVVHDLSDDPAEWEQSIEELFRVVSPLVFTDPRKPDQRPAPDESTLVKELVAAVRTEYEALFARHRETPRTPPPTTPYFESRPREEQEEILARIRADLEREPLWGPWLEQKWRSRLEQLEARAAAGR